MPTLTLKFSPHDIEFKIPSRMFVGQNLEPEHSDYITLHNIIQGNVFKSATNKKAMPPGTQFTLDVGDIEASFDYVFRSMCSWYDGKENPCFDLGDCEFVTTLKIIAGAREPVVSQGDSGTGQVSNTLSKAGGSLVRSIMQSGPFKTDDTGRDLDVALADPAFAGKLSDFKALPIGSYILGCHATALLAVKLPAEVCSGTVNVNHECCLVVFC